VIEAHLERIQSGTRSRLKREFFGKRRPALSFPEIPIEK
jgi:hypothetical protein